MPQHRVAHLFALQLHCNYSHRRKSVTAIWVMSASAAAALIGHSCGGTADNDVKRQLLLCRRTSHCDKICKCEKHHTNTQRSDTPPATTLVKPSELQPLSRLTLWLYASKLYPHSHLPTPRLLSPRDPVFSYPELKRGLRQRRNDEDKVKEMLSSQQVIEARKSQDPAKMQQILQEMNSVVYGKGITPQLRENWLMEYGCTGYTDEVLQYLVDSFQRRGIIEVGSGNGQWARSLSDYYHKLMQTKRPELSANSSWDFILASDNMEQLPLSPKVYHNNTLPATKYFYNKVRRASHIDAVKEARGRALLLVYPPPGSMALETVHAYINSSLGYSGSNKNDTVVYVGEGRGGANADDAFFDYFLGSDGADGHTSEHYWVLEKVMDVLPCPGGKGYEKLFVFRRQQAT